MVSENVLHALATKFPSGQYTTLCSQLGYRYNVAQGRLQQHMNNTTSGVIPRQGGQAAASIHFSDGGGGVKVRKMPNFSARFARKVPISNFSRKARRKNENCVCLVVFLC